MKASDIPPKFPLPFAADAGTGFINPIPEASQIGVNPGYASLTDGSPPLNFEPVAAGGIPPRGADMNGIINQATAWSRWQNAGAPVPFDADFSAAIGGYPNGAMVAALTPGYFWYSTIDDNTSNPETGGANWISFCPSGTATTGDIKWRPTNRTLPGWVFANGTTIGNAASLATGRANADTAALFALLWMDFSNSQCPVTPGGRGASPAADFAANKQIQVLSLQGTNMIGVDGMGGSITGRLAGVPIISGNTTTPGSILGENLHTLSVPEIPSHLHSVAAAGDTGNESALHVHGGSGTTTGQSNDHSHGFTAMQVIGAGQSGSEPTRLGQPANSSTGGVSADHTHNFSFVTGTENTSHVHSWSFAVNSGSAGGGGSHNNVELSMLGSVYLKL
jgi:hypothetical protein